MSYYVKQTDGAFNIIEKDSELLMTSTRNEKEANKMCRSLNLGSGFNGFTPAFFCYVYKTTPN